MLCVFILPIIEEIINMQLFYMYSSTNRETVNNYHVELK